MIYKYSKSKLIQYRASARAFAGQRMDKLIRLLDLWPQEDWRNWRDDFGNLYLIKKDKNLAVKLGKTEPVVRDLYFKSDIQLLLNNCYWLLFARDDTKSLFCILGNDGKLRCRVHEGQVLKIVPPGLLGSSLLNLILEKYSEEFEEINLSNISFNFEFKPINGYITSYPIENIEIQKVLKEYKID